ncbi:MAG: amino acid-binding protein [Actinomycetota bacterium]|nr:amino acid-binding protein [Actinomycetota bacterium]
MATDLLLSLDDRPGELALVGETLGKAGINIEGLCAIGYEGRGIVHVLVENATAARRALETAGVKVEGETDVAILDVSGDADKPGALGRHARKVADAGVNVRFSYLITNGRAVIGADDIVKLRETLAM